MKKEVELTTELVEALSMSQMEPEWLLEKRIEMVQAVAHLPQPMIKRANIQRWDFFTGNHSPFVDFDERVYDFAQKDDQAMIVQQENQTTIEQISSDDMENGVIVSSLEQALSEHEDLLKEYLFKEQPQTSVDAYHNAVTTGGVFIYIPKNVVVKQPIELHFFQNEAADQYFGKEIIVVTDENSHVEIAEFNRPMHEGQAEEVRSLSVHAHIFAKPGAKVQYTAFDEFGEKMTGMILRKASVQRDASVDWTISAMNRGKIAYQVETNLLQSGACSENRMTAISDGCSEQIFAVKTDNLADHTVGHILQHGIVQDKGTVVFNGVGHIAKGGAEAEATQESRILMMSDKGRGDANPILLIDHDDVIANHAASIGQLNEEDIFYLMSRGLTLREAEKFVARGFLEPVIQSANHDLQQELWEFIERKLA